MTREAYVREELLALGYRWMDITLLVGSMMFLLIGILDYSVFREHFQKFVLLRVAIAMGLLTIMALLRLARRHELRKVWLHAGIIVGTLLSAATVETMILDLGGHRSFYYAGLSLLVIGLLGFLPLGFVFSLALCGIVYLVYLVPILVAEPIVNPLLFFSNNFFLLSTIAVSLVWRTVSQKNLVRMYGLQYEMNQDKAKLQDYSEQLSRLVDERTADLRRSEEMLRALREQASDGIVTLNRDGVILDVNRKTCEIHGFERATMIGMSLEAFLSERDRERFRERMGRILGGESLLYEAEHLRKDGRTVSLEVSARAVEVGGTILVQSFHRDVTEKKRLQQQLLHSQKMESVGLLAGGIAHDFNNILTAILGQAEVVLMSAEIDEQVARRVRDIEGAAMRGTQLIGKILNFARAGSPETWTFNVNSVIRDTMGMIVRLLPKRIQLVQYLRDPLPQIEGDPSQIEQVIMNLVINARDAIGERGEIVLRTDLWQLGSREAEIGEEIVPGRYVMIEVSDSGAGIAEADLPRIFEPFFTTKERGKGTGLGLAVVYGIVKERRGYLSVQSAMARGTSFRLFFPVAEVPAPTPEQALREGLRTRPA